MSQTMQSILTINQEQFRFNLTPEFLKNIKFTEDLEAYLQVDPPSQQQLINILSNSGCLTFSSYYLNEGIIQTIFFANGQVIQKISQDCLPYPELLRDITRIHHLLVERILLVKLEKKRSKLRFSWQILLIIGILLLLLAIALLSNM